MIRVGIVGIGFMGWIHYLAYQRSKLMTLAAICTTDPKKRAGDWTSIQGNFGPPGTMVDLTGIATMADWKQLVASPDIDAIDICLPPALHRSVAIAALDAGKHVLCEKPMALTIEDCAAMQQAAVNNKRILNIAHVLPFMSAFQFAAQSTADGRFGSLRSAHFRRVIADPTWLPDFYKPEKVGGPMIDLLVHDAHLMRLMLGMPTEVTAIGWRTGKVLKFAQMLYRFADTTRVATAIGGVSTSAARQFSHGIELQWEEAAMNFESTAATAVQTQTGPLLCHGDSDASLIELPHQDEVDPFLAELDDFAAAILNKPTSGNLDCQLAVDAIRICAAVERSAKEGKPVSISIL